MGASAAPPESGGAALAFVPKKEAALTHDVPIGDDVRRRGGRERRVGALLMVTVSVRTALGVVCYG